MFWQDEGLPEVTVGRVLFNGERQRAIDEHIAWLSNPPQFHPQPIQTRLEEFLETRRRRRDSR